MYHQQDERPRTIEHCVELTNDDVKQALLTAAREKYPSVPYTVKITFTKDMFGCNSAELSWTEIER
jgi:hypothetical protein